MCREAKDGETNTFLTILVLLKQAKKIKTLSSWLD
jgi:hypothetical protein